MSCIVHTYGQICSLPTIYHPKCTDTLNTKIAKYKNLCINVNCQASLKAINIALLNKIAIHTAHYTYSIQDRHNQSVNAHL